jgi:hypothetical protein
MVEQRDGVNIVTRRSHPGLKGIEGTSSGEECRTARSTSIFMDSVKHELRRSRVRWNRTRMRSLNLLHVVSS